MSKKIHLDSPNLGEREKQYLNRAIDSGYISTIGPSVSEFENKCAEYLGIKNAVSTNSGTAALHIALYELGIGRGDEVIIPALTFVATANPVLYLGATPVIVDVHRETWNMEPEAIEMAITDRTRAIVPVHLYGNPCDMNEINRIAAQYHLHVVEDAAESLGASYDGRPTGTMGDLGCISFNGNKTITTAGGGMVVGKNQEQMEHIKLLINQARDREKEMYHAEIGFNYRMTNLQAALGLAQFERLDEFLARKKLFNDCYKEELRALSTIRFQKEYALSQSSYWFTCIMTGDPAHRLELQNHLNERGVPTRRIFRPINEFPPYHGARFINNGNAQYIYERGLCLPSSTLNDVEAIRMICTAVKEFCCEGSTVH